MFDRETVNRIMALLNPPNSGDQDLLLHWTGDLILCQNDDFDAEEPVSDDNIRFFTASPGAYVFNGIKLDLWSIGDGWTWNAVKFDLLGEDSHLGANG
ncbi:hypothetical protein [Massilia sp. TWR1-2-2]|uniref:hypothetical protein n=1 Tax=Massilia sp. TWR1-2-2 TaxID=2804584 RepID=UPI003CF41C86